MTHWFLHELGIDTRELSYHSLVFINLRMCGDVVLVLFYIHGASGLLRFSNSYSDYMVLQRGPQSAILWGYADIIHDFVTVYINDVQVAEGTVSQNPNNTQQGIWKIKLPPETDPGPFDVTVTSSEGNVTLNDVLFGDVWLCSGQSNMRFRMRELINATAEINESLSFTNIRMLFTSLVQSTTPKDDVILEHQWIFPIQGIIDEFSALCFLYAKELYLQYGYPIGVIASSWGGTPIEVWSSPSAIAACPKTDFPRRWPTPSVLWNSMIYPYLRMTIKGVIWYQGEGNRWFPNLYDCQFLAMIKDWRQKFHEGSDGETSSKFPFGFVQLAPFRPNPSIIGGFPRIRWAQSNSVGYVPNDNMQNTFMAVAIDLPDFNSTSGVIHPRYKLDIAKRLALGARHVAYEEYSVKFKGPFPTDYLLNIHQQSLMIIFDDGLANLLVNNYDGFEVCCTNFTSACDRVHQWTRVNINDTYKSSVDIDISVCDGNNVEGIRYLWRESPCALRQCPLYDRDTNLPVPPFIKTWSAEVNNTSRYNLWPLLSDSSS